MVIQHAEVCRRIERDIELQGSLRRTAALYGVSTQYLSAALLGKRSIGAKLCKALRLKRHVEKIATYQEVRRAKS